MSNTSVLGWVRNCPLIKEKSQWWLTVELPKFHETMDYYRWFIDREWTQADERTMKRNYHRPSHPPHVSVSRGEEPRKNKGDWGKFMANKKIRIKYSGLVRQTSLARDGKDHFWFVDAQVEEYNELRKHFGLQWQRDGVPFKGHITIARAY